MRRKRYSPEQVVRKPCEAEAEVASGKSVEEVCKKLEVSRQTHFRWKKEYGSGIAGWRHLSGRTSGSRDMQRGAQLVFLLLRLVGLLRATFDAGAAAHA